MDTLVYISAAALVFVIIMVFVNARRVSDLRSEVENIPQPDGYTYRDTSLQTGSEGTIGPKKYYWLKISEVNETIPTAASSADDKIDRAELKLDVAAKGTDNDQFTKDVQAERIGGIYRPEENILMAVAPIMQSGKFSGLQLLKKKGSRIVFSDIPTTRHCTVIGLPPSVEGPVAF